MVSNTLGEKRYQAACVYLAWLLWKARNARVFEGIYTDPYQLVRQLVVLNYNSTFSTPLRYWDCPYPANQRCLTSISVAWQSPPFRVLKINFDGAVKADGAAAAYVIRDYQGMLIRAASRQLFNVSVPYAGLRGIQPPKNPAWPLVSDLFSWKTQMILHPWKISHVYREANQTADWLASNSGSVSLSFDHHDVLPNQLSNIRCSWYFIY